MFRDRQEAGKRLAEVLASCEITNAVILALPRGGVPIGYEIAHRFGLPLDIISVRKIGHPLHPEYAIGAVDEQGRTLFNEEEKSVMGKLWLAGEIVRQRAEAERRALLYRGDRRHIKLKGKIVIIVDDGIATGLTIRVAIQAIREEEAIKIVVAVPLASIEAASILRREADEFIVLVPPSEFAGAVGAHYEHFPQVSDEEVVRLLSNTTSN